MTIFSLATVCLNLLGQADKLLDGATVFAYQVTDPTQYGVIAFNRAGKPVSIVEKPSVPKSPFAVCGMYFVDGTAPERAAKLVPSGRGELEITSLLEAYLADRQLNAITLGRGHAWLDVGTHGSLLDAGNFVRTLSERQGLQIGSPDEIAFCKGWITSRDLLNQACRFGKSSYGRYLQKICTVT